MKKYRIIVLNEISNKKTRIKIEAFSFEKAVEKATWKIHHVSESIIKCELITN